MRNHTYNDSMSTAVVAAGDCSESLLPCCVPNLQLDCLPIQLDSTDFKVNPDCADVALQVRIICKPQKKARLSNTRISNQQQLEKIIIFRIHLARRRKKAATDEIASSGLLTTQRGPRSKATARNLPSSSPPPAQHRSSFKQSFLNGTPKKERKKKCWTRAEREEIRRNRPAEEQQKKKGGGKKTTGRGDGAKKRGFATQRRFAL
jgi:hypothetical protein